MCFRDCIYPVAPGCACYILLLNIVLPGTGTMLQSFCGKKCSPGTFFLGILQLLCVALIFGWCWAIWHAEMVRCVSGPDHLGKPAPETEPEGDAAADAEKQEA